MELVYRQQSFGDPLVIIVTITAKIRRKFIYIENSSVIVDKCYFGGAESETKTDRYAFWFET